MHSLTPTTALGTAAPSVESIGAITLREETDFAFASLTARRDGEKATSLALAKFIGVKVPGPNSSATHNGITAIWMGPDQWMVEAPYATHELLAEDLKAKVKKAASVTEQSGGWARFDMLGENPVASLERLCVLNTRDMQTDDAGRTTIDHTGCFVICRQTGVHFSILVPRSSAGSVHHAIVTSLKSIG